MPVLLSWVLVANLQAERYGSTSTVIFDEFSRVR
jgi:hypothetical protein